jgi:ATP synthase protein I
MTKPSLPNDIKELDNRIRALKQKQDPSSKPISSAQLFWKNAFQIATEFIAPVFVGISIGYLLDKCFNTRILFVFIWAIFGLAAGMLNMWRAAKQMEKDINRG